LLLWLSNRGVGSAVVVGGQLMRGAHLGAGEIGFIPVPDLAEATTSPTGQRFGDRLAAAAILDLARVHGIVGTTPLDCLQQAMSTSPHGDAFVRDLARRIAAGLAAVVGLLDPELILLAGEIGTAGGDAFSRAISDELQLLVKSDVQLRTAGEQSNSVRAGAIHAALSSARERVFAAASSTNP
jgi:predicted NBD/HSP70 family sugar kinase